MDTEKEVRELNCNIQRNNHERERRRKENTRKMISTKEGRRGREGEGRRHRGEKMEKI